MCASVENVFGTVLASVVVGRADRRVSRLQANRQIFRRGQPNMFAKKFATLMVTDPARQTIFIALMTINVGLKEVPPTTNHY
jgi:hypothetical protein